MASPTLETLCCILEKNSTHFHPSVHLNFSRHDLPYNILSIVSSIAGAIGAITLLLPRSPLGIPSLRSDNLTGSRQRKIISWLAISDLLAAIGIFVRAVFWLSYENHNPGCHAEQVVCAVTSGWIQYFYTATYFWTLSYAVEVFCSLKQIDSFSIYAYHFGTWSFSTVLTIVGLSILYHPQLRCFYDLPHLLPNYLCVLVPLVLVMLLNPILYGICTRQVSEMLSSSSGMFSYRERRVKTSVRDKFFRMVVVFYVCWLANIINGIVMWTLWRNIEENSALIFSIWYLMAVLNPLQAAFNAFVYRGNEKALRFIDLKESVSDWLPQARRLKDPGGDSSHPDEQTPLLTDKRSGPRNVPDELSVNGHFFNF